MSPCSCSSRPSWPTWTQETGDRNRTVWYSPIMVKRNDIHPGTRVKVAKLMPPGAHAGPAFTDVLNIDEELDILSTPFSRGPLNLVKVRRRLTGETTELIYAFVTNFCKLAASDKPPPQE
jgi:hypothetical protein